MNDLNAIVLAAGLGTRMKSPLPKVIQPLCGLPMIEWVLRALEGAGAGHIRLVVGHGAEHVKKAVQKVERQKVSFHGQKTQLGTADAVKAAEPATLRGLTLICYGDHPLIQAEDFENLIDGFKKRKLDLAVVSAVLKSGGDFGRILRDQNGRLTGIVEKKEASPEQLKIREVNTGIYLIKAEHLDGLVRKIGNNNSKGEYYLTDMIALALAKGLKTEALAGSIRVSRGVNTQVELAQASQVLHRRKLRDLMLGGVRVVDTACTYVEADVQVGEGSVLHPGVQLSGRTRIGKNVIVENNSFIKDSQVANDVCVKWGSIIDQSSVGRACLIGPYARLRPQTRLGEECHIGNFVELKKVDFGSRSKANHLTYLGDAEIGEDTNIGCGTITCNYAVDRKKYKTRIGNRVFVGSDTQFVAPVNVGDDAVVASGSTVTQDVPSGSLAIARGRQVNKAGYVVGSKKEK